MTDEEGKYQFHYALEDFTVNEDIRHVKILVQNTLMDNKTNLYGKPVFLNRIYYHNKLDLFVGVFYIFENNKDILQTMPEELADYVQKCIEERNLKKDNIYHRKGVTCSRSTLVLREPRKIII